jgi:hypothetical protein
MPAGLVVPISGPYVGTMSALVIGTLNDDGYELAATIQGQEINETDAYGMTLVEAIYRGQNWRLRMRGLEWKAGLLAILHGFGAQAALAAGLLGPTLEHIGDRWTKFCSSLVLTAILGNPPTAPQSLTALSAAVAPQQQSVFNLTSKMRELPLEMVLLPYSAAIGSLTLNVPFTVT